MNYIAIHVLHKTVQQSQQAVDSRSPKEGQGRETWGGGGGGGPGEGEGEEEGGLGGKRGTWGEREGEGVESSQLD